MTHRTADADLMPLPHPVRTDAAFGGPFEETFFREMGFMQTLGPYLADSAAPTEWILNHVPGMARLALADLGAPGSFNMGSFVLMLTRARLRAHGDPILEVSPPLQALLAQTDLAAGLPVRLFRCPYPVVYVALAQPSGLVIHNRLSGIHELEGAYVCHFEVPAGSPLFERPARLRALRLDPRRAMRVIELTLTGSPLGKANALDDASQDVALFIQDEDEPLDTLLARHVAYYSCEEGVAGPLFETPHAAEMAALAPAVEALAKVLLYLNLPEAEQARVNERTALAQRLRGLGPKKAKRLGRRLASAYDRILIGPRTLTPATDDGAATQAPQGPGRSLKPHWRRGHFRRIRFGEGLSESRVGWIQPVLVNAADAFAPVMAKPYQVR